MDNLFQLIRMAQSQSGDVKEQAKILSAFGPPPEEFEPKMNLPVQNDLPSFSLKQPGLGGELVGKKHGVPAPMFGEKGARELSLGEILIGDTDAS